MGEVATLSPATLARRIARAALADYGLTDAPIARLSHDYNTTFRVEAPHGRCVLRIQSLIGAWAKTPAQVRSELQWLAALRRDTTLGVPAPVPTLGGELVAVATAPGVCEPRVCSLVRWLPGRFVNKGLRPIHLERVGAFTAHLHEHAADFAPPPGFTHEPVGALTGEQIDRARRIVGEQASSADAGVVESAVEKAALALAGVEREPGQVGLIHADLHQFNYLFHQSDVRAIDFDDCGIGPLLYDLAVTINTLGARPDLPELRDALLRGYRSVRPLPAHVDSRLDALIAVRTLQDIPGVLDPNDTASQAWLPRALAGGLPRLRAYAASRPAAARA